MTKKIKSKGKTKTPTTSGTFTTPNTKAYAMELNYVVSDPYAHMSLEELEKAFDLAGARMTYAHNQEISWRSETQKRGEEFNKICVAYKSKKHGFTAEQIKGNPNTSTAVWSYAK